MGSRESLSSHSSEKNGQAPLSSPPSSPTTEASLSPAATASPPAASAPPLATSSSWTQLTSSQQTSSVSSLLSTERTLSAKAHSNASLSSIKEAGVPLGGSAASSPPCPPAGRACSLRDSPPVQTGPSLASLRSSSSADRRGSSLTETPHSASPQQLYGTGSSSSSSSSSLFTYQLSTSSSLTSLHISEGKSRRTAGRTRTDIIG